MLAQSIPIDRIDLPKSDPQIRTLCKAFTVKLADSIEVAGLVQPVVLRPSPESPGRYLLVCGRHRYHAVAKVLKHKVIDAIVRDDLDEVGAERLTLAENLWQCPLNKPQRERSFHRWFQSYRTWFDAQFGSDSQALVTGSKNCRRPTLSGGYDQVED
jgi:ParB family chromosome partitioning protein